MRSSKGLTATEVLLTTAVLGIAATVLLFVLTSGRFEARRRRCQSNLHQIARGMAAYLVTQGGNRYWPWPAGRAGCGPVGSPEFGGAEWLATLHWTRVIPDPSVFLCPATSDSNRGGLDLGSEGTPGGRPLSSHAVSYAGMHDRSVGVYIASCGDRHPEYASRKIAIRDDYPPNEAMACDDTQDPINHGEKDNGGMNVLFFDSHMEYWTHGKVDLERCVGQSGGGYGTLTYLRN